MADGRWVMTEAELESVALGFDGNDYKSLPNYGKRAPVDNRDGEAEHVCAFCGSPDLQDGFGGYGEGFGYHASRCRECGGMTEFVYKDEICKYFE